MNANTKRVLSKLNESPREKVLKRAKNRFQKTKETFQALKKLCESL